MPESIAEHKHNPHEKTQHTASVSLLTAWVLIIAAFLKWLISWRYFNYEDSEMAGLNLGNHFVLDFLQGLSAWTTALLTGACSITFGWTLCYFNGLDVISSVSSTPPRSPMSASAFNLLVIHPPSWLSRFSLTLVGVVTSVFFWTMVVSQDDHLRNSVR